MGLRTGPNQPPPQAVALPIKEPVPTQNAAAEKPAPPVVAAPPVVVAAT